TREFDSSYLASRISTLMKWFNEDFPPNIYSLMQKSIAEWEDKLISDLTMKGIRIASNRKPPLTKAGRAKYYKIQAHHISFLRAIYRVLHDFYDTRSVYEKDLWDLDKLGFKRIPANHVRRINFTRIDQLWLRKIVKTYLRYCLSIYS